MDQNYDSPLTRLKNVLFGKIIDPVSDFLSSSKDVDLINVGDWKKTSKDEMPARELNYRLSFGIEIWIFKSS